jgi:hypothetical protein
VPCSTLHLEDRPDGVVDLLKFLGDRIAQMPDEAATGADDRSA